MSKVLIFETIGFASEIKNKLKKYFTDIEKIEKLYFKNCWTYKQILDHFINSNGHNLYIKRGDKIISYCLCIVNDEFIEILKIATMQSQRGRGFANSLLDKVEEFGINNSLKRICLEVDETNNLAIDLYKKRGFQTDGLRKKYYKNSNNNAVLMSKGI